jgi:hypothetical protein
MIFNIKEENKGIHQETSLDQLGQRIYAQIEFLTQGVNTIDYTPQSFNQFAQFTGIYGHLRKNLTDDAMSIIEGLVSLYGALSSVTDATGFISVLTLYVKTHNQTSLLGQIQKIATNLFSDMTPQSTERPKWLNDMSSALTNWKLLVNSPSFAKISRVVSLLVTLGITDRVSVSLGNFEIFAVEALNKQANAVDLIDAVVETISFFAEGAYQCFLSGSIKPLLFSSNQIVELEEKYIQLQSEWEFVRNGNLQKFSGKDESEFDKDLSDTIDTLNTLYKTMPNGTEKKIVQQKWEALSKIRADFVSSRVRGGLRKSPLCVKIYGNSGVGKSTFADLTLAAVLKAINAPSSPDHIVTLDERDKYMSSYRSYVTGIKLDDYGNSKADFWEAAPSDWIITICNNIRQAAIMADIANKGKVSIEPRCLTITTNVKELHAGVTSNNPMSILRRAHLHVTLKVRPEFLTDNMLDSQKVLDAFGSLDTINDIWLIDIEKPIGDGEGKQNFSSWQILHKDLNIHEYLNIVISKAISHDQQQTSIVDSFKDPASLIEICSTCNRMSNTCTCEMEPHFGERIATTIKDKVASTSIVVQKLQLVAETRIEDYAVDALLTGYASLAESPYSYWTSWIPEKAMDNDYVKAGILYAGQDWIGQALRTYALNYAICTIFIAAVLSRLSYFLSFFTCGICALYFFVCYAGVVEAKKHAYLQEIHKRRGVLPELFKSVRDKHVQYACGLFASLSVIYAVVKIVKALRVSLSMQGSLQPRCISDIQQRDEESNPWAPTTQVPTTASKYFATNDMARERIAKSLGQIVIGNQFSGAIAVTTGVLGIPFHFLPSETTNASFNLNGRIIKFILNPELAVRIGNADMALIFVPNTGPLRDIVPFFNTTNITNPTQATVVGLRQDRTMFDSRIMWQLTPGVSNGPYVFNGAYYNLTGMETFPGMCMSAIISETSRKTILGFHIGGVTGTSKGCGLSILQTDLTFALEALFAKSKTFVRGPQASELDDVVAGKKIVISTEVHKKCPTNWLEPDAAVEVYGSVTRSNAFESSVIPTPISPIVEEVCGVPNIYGPPKFKQPVVREDGHIDNQLWRPWYASLSTCSQPSIGFDPVDVDWAMDDYLYELKEVFGEQKELWEKDLRPLSNVEIVSGVDGKRFIDSMNSSTSMGYPIGGPKTNYLIDLDPTPSNACPRTFKPEIWALVEELNEKAKSGVFLNQIFGASLKDEPTKVTKEKVRVFQAAPIALQILIRKYFLPVARFLSMNPLLSECAVGINSHGPEWHELSEHMAKFGDERIIAGDFAKYDLRMPEQLTLTAFAVMMEIAQWSGNYTPLDLRVMRSIAHDVCSPLVAYNGTLVRFMGTNPSGQNMTVYINSIVNSLLHRLAFNDAYPQEELTQIGSELGLNRTATFRDLCAISTYGDDAKGSVRPGYDKFNHISMAEFLAKNDITFTMPDKESEPIAFMSRFEADFLKRKDMYNPDLKQYVGALDENSIFKSLHSIMKSKVVSPLTVSAMNLSGAMREFFFHGRRTYEFRQEQMKKIAKKANLSVPDLDITYDERVAQWNERYVTPVSL